METSCNRVRQLPLASWRRPHDEPLGRVVRRIARREIGTIDPAVDRHGPMGRDVPKSYVDGRQWGPGRLQPLCVKAEEGRVVQRSRDIMASARPRKCRRRAPEPSPEGQSRCLILRQAGRGRPAAAAGLPDAQPT